MLSLIQSTDTLINQFRYDSYTRTLAHSKEWDDLDVDKRVDNTEIYTYKRRFQTGLKATFY